MMNCVDVDRCRGSNAQKPVEILIEDLRCVTQLLNQLDTDSFFAEERLVKLDKMAISKIFPLAGKNSPIRGRHQVFGGSACTSVPHHVFVSGGKRTDLLANADDNSGLRHQGVEAIGDLYPI